jgi:hypothetical protein
MSALLAIGWEPELRGILTVIIGRGGAVRQHLPDPGTNMGARLGFLVALAGLAGWMFAHGRGLVDRTASACSARTPLAGSGQQHGHP